MKPDFEGFARAVLELRSDADFADVDGGDLQDVALKYGVLVEVEAPEPCAPAGCWCAEECYGADFPVTCIRPWDWNEAKETT